MLFAVLLLGCVVSLTVLWGWSQRDQFLTRTIRKTLEEKFPEWKITFDTAELDHHGRVVLTNVILNPHSTSHPLLSVQGVRVTVDRDLMLKQQKLDVQSLELNRPQLMVVRETSGQWNWQNLPLIEGDAPSPPLIKLRDARIIVQWEHEQFARAMRVQVDAIDADLVPTAKHRLRFQGVGREKTLGNSQFAGEFDTLSKTWELSGELKGLRLDQPFLQAAAMISPEADRMVAALQKSHRKEWLNIADHKGDSPDSQPVAMTAQSTFSTGSLQRNSVETTSVETTTVAAHTTVNRASAAPIQQVSNSQSLDKNFALQLTVDLKFHGSQQEKSLPDFTVFANLVNGQIDHPDLPLPLDKIQGQIAIDRLGIRIDDMQLASGPTAVDLTGSWGWEEGNLPSHVQEELKVSLTNYQVTTATRDYLPLSLRNLHDELSPEGTLSIAFALRRGLTRPIDFDLFRAEVRNGSVKHELFAYPIQEVSGTIVRTDHGIGPEAWDVQMNGMASGRPIEVTGTVVDPGPDCETVFDIQVDQLPIDHQFYRALQPQHREIMEHLNLFGKADVHCSATRKLSNGRKTTLRITADVSEGSMNVKRFPLSLDQVSGHINFDESGWQLTRLTGMHGDTKLNGYGSVLPENGEWKLDLSIDAEQAHFDHDLFLAIETASPEVAKIWSRLRPRGNFDLSTKIRWITGQTVEVNVPLMKLQGCEIKPTPFPWRVTDMYSTVTIGENGVVSFENLKAKHDQCRIETSGAFSPHKDYWQLRFENLLLDDLSPDHEFMAAVPTTFRTLMESMKVKAPSSLEGKLEFKGNYSGTVVTAGWDVKAVVNQIDLHLGGVDIKNASGTMNFQGEMDHKGVVSIPKGNLAIDSCWVLGFHVTDVKGPFTINKDQIVLGSPKMFEQESKEEEWNTVSREERVTGRIFNGELFLDLLAKRTPSMPYWLRCTLSRASLEQWAIQNNYGQANIRGEVNGYIDLAGDNVSARNTVGNGFVQISPAALYELPVMLQVFQNLRFAPVDQTAFRNAHAEFRVLDEKFVFDEIGLLGESMTLYGQGTVRFDRTIDLDFIYRPPKRTNINVVSKVLNHLDGVMPVLFTVQVEGTVDYPKVSVNPGMRETLKGFGKMLEMAPGNLTPPKITPPARIRMQPTPHAMQQLVPAF